MSDNELIIQIPKVTGEEAIEVCRSFAFKLNCGNYESADFFCSAKQHAPASIAEDLSERLFMYCRREVLRNVADFQRERPDYQAKNARTK